MELELQSEARRRAAEPSPAGRGAPEGCAFLVCENRAPKLWARTAGCRGETQYSAPRLSHSTSVRPPAASQQHRTAFRMRNELPVSHKAMISPATNCATTCG